MGKPLKTMNTPRTIISLLMLGTPLLLSANTSAERALEDQVKSTYTFREALDGEVDVKIENGVAILTGSVEDASHRRLAEDTVAEIDGITRVDNRIRVENEAKEGSDEWVALKIRGMLLAKANVSLTQTDVIVRNGVVTLEGTAESDAQKALTEAYVKEIDGVVSVQNNLKVVDRAAVEANADGRERAELGQAEVVDGDVHRRTVGDKIDDASITAQVKYELLANDATRGLQMDVDTINGHVVLSGEAMSDAEKTLATKLARSIRGVQSVENNMTVATR